MESDKMQKGRHTDVAVAMYIKRNHFWDFNLLENATKCILTRQRVHFVALQNIAL